MATDEEGTPPLPRPLVVACALLTVASWLPIWIFRYQPLPDLANHMAASSIWVHLHDPAWHFDRYYALNLGLNPYWGYYAPMRLIAPVVGIDVANRIVLSAYVLALPLGFSWLLRRLGASPWLALFSFSFLWTLCFFTGFIHTSIGLALAPAAIAAFDSYCARPSWRRAIVAVALGCAVYFCHVVPFLLTLGCDGLVGLLHRQRTRRRMLGRVAVFAAILAVAVGVSLLGSGKGMGAAPSRYSFSCDPHPLQLLKQLYDWTWNDCTGPEDELLASLLMIAWLALVATARWTRPTLHQLRPLACALAALGGYLLLPKSVLTPQYSWGVKYRLAAWALLFLVLVVPGAIVGWRRWLLLPVFVAGLGFAVDTGWHWRRANAFTAGFDEATAALPPGARPLFIFGKPFGDPSLRLQYLQSWPSLYQAAHGGYNPWLFDDFPLRFRERFPAPPWQTMAFDWAQHAAYYDYVVTFQRPPQSVFGAHTAEVSLVRQAGTWSVWKLPGPRVDTPPGPAYPSSWASDPRWRP